MYTMIQGWFQGGPSSRGDEAPSLLDRWKQYEAQSQGQGYPMTMDIESSIKSVTDPLAPMLQGAKTTMTGAWASVSQTAQDLPGNIQKGANSLPSSKAFVYFLATLSSGILFIMLSFTMFLPVIVLAPQKFALCFTIGSLLVMSSFFVLKGPLVQLEHMISAERLPFTLIFAASIAATIYVSMVMHSYIFSLICSGFQVVALLYYVISYFPGGATGLRFLTSMGSSAFWGLFGR